MIARNLPNVPDLVRRWRYDRIRSRRSPLMMGVLVVGVLLGVGALWVGATAFMARSELNQVRVGAPELRAQLTAAEIGDATTSADTLARHARRAHHLTRGPAWAVASRVPLLGEPFKTARGITAAADELGRNALPLLVSVGTDIDPDKLRSDDGRIDVEALRRVAPAIDQASASINRAIAITAGLPASTWLNNVDVARTDVLEQLTSIAHVAESSSQAAKLLPPMLGADKPQTYFLAFQNNAEARGTGGLPGAFAIVKADKGEFEFSRFENDGFLNGVSAKVNLGKDYNNLYRNSGTTDLYVNGNLSPHFPYAAQIWASMWQRKTGENVDGVLAVDPEALSYLLGVTGPAKLGDGTDVSAANVVQLTQSTAYSRFPVEQDAARRAFLLDIAKSVAAKITDAHGNATGLAKALANAAQERRLLAWSADPELEKSLEATPLSGSVPETAEPYAGLTIINEGGNKLDYYLDRSLLWERTGCGRDRKVTVTVKLTNTAPKGLSNYVASRSDDPPYPIKVGDHRVSVVYAGTEGGLLQGVTLDGKVRGAQVGVERGHPVFSVDVELPRGKTRTIMLNLTEPAAKGNPIVFKQPLVRPLAVDLRDNSC